MTNLAHKTQRRFYRLLPEWIANHADHRELKQGPRNTLQGIANMCDPPDQAGSLLGAYSGQKLFDACGISKSTFIRHIRTLERLGFVVKIGQGGQFGRYNVSNTYGIPGKPGALDDHRVHGPIYQRLHDGHKLRMQKIEPGEQATFWHRDQLTPTAQPGPQDAQPKPREPEHRDTLEECNRGGVKTPGGVVSKTRGGSVNLTRGVVSKRHGGGVKLTHYQSPIGNPSKNQNHGCGTSELRTSMGRPRLPRITPDDLTDLDRLLELFDRVVLLGLVDGSEASRLTFVATALECVQVGANPCALFAHRVGKGQWLVTQSAEDEARRRLRAHLFGESPGPKRTSHPRCSDPATKPSSDVRLLESVLARVPGAADSRGVCFSACKQIDPTWSAERQERAEADSEYGRRRDGSD